MEKGEWYAGGALATLEDAESWIVCMTYVEQEGALFIGSRDNTVKKWDAKMGETLAALQGYADTIEGMTYVEKQGPLFTGGSDDNTVKKWNMKMGKRWPRLRMTREGSRV